MKALFVALVIILSVAFFVAGCGNSPTTSAPPVSSSAPTSSAPSTTTAAPTTQPTSTVKPTVPTQPTTTAPSTSTSQYGGTLKIIIPTAISTMGAPAEGGNIGDFNRVAGPVYDRLVNRDKDFNIKPMLVQSWDMTPDGKTITLHLQKGVKFHDGTDFNADAVKYALQNSGTFASNLKKVASYDILDDYTLRLNMSQFDANLFLNLSAGFGGWIGSPTAIKKPTTPENQAKDHMVGTGPFKFVSTQRDVSAKYTRFDNYWQKGKPYFDAVEFTQVQDPVTSLLYFKAGNGQLLFQVTPYDARNLAAAGYDIVLSDVKFTYYMMPDGANADSPWGNVKVRQALDYAVNKKAITDAIGLGYYEPLNQLATTNSPLYVKDVVARSYDPAKAKQILTEAGYPNGFKTTLITSTTFNKDALVAIQADLKKVGIDATIDVADSGRFTSVNQNGWRNAIFIMYPPMNIDLSGLIRRFAVGGATPETWSHRSMFRPTDWQSRLDAALTQVDDGKRITQMQGLIKTMFDEAMAIPLWAAPDISAQDTRLHDLNWEQGQPYNFTFQDAWMAK